MVNRIGFGLLSMVIAGSLYAGDNVSQSQPFIGFEVGYAAVQGDVADGPFLDDIKRDYEGSDVEFGLRIGAQLDEWRTTIFFDYFDGNDGGYKQNYEKGGLALDYFFTYEKGERFKPFIGLNVGYINYESDNNIDMSGFLYGAQAGFVINIVENIDIDVQYRYSLSSASQNDRDAALDHTGSILFGINYIY